MRVPSTYNKKRSTEVFTLVRSSATIPDRDEAIQRSGAFGRSVNDCTAKHGVVTLLTARDQHNVSSFVLTPGQGIESHVVKTLCSAIGAKAIPIEDNFPAINETEFVGWLNAHPSQSASVATQAGGEQSEVALLLSRIMQPGSWVAATLRAPKKSEIRRTRDWFNHRRDGAVTHYSKSPNTVIVSYVAGANTKEEVDLLLTQITSVIPGFDVDVKPGKVWNGIPIRLGVPLALVAGLAVKIGLKFNLTESIIAAVAVLVFSLVSKFMPTNNRVWASRINETLSHNELPRPLKRHAPPRKPINKTTKNQEGVEKNVKKDGSYPLAASSLLVSPAMTIGIVSPHAGASVAMSEARMPSAALLDDVGPVVGDATADDNDEVITTPTHIDAAEGYQGIFLYGTPGSGKTIAVQNLWAWNALERVRPSGKPGRPGSDNTLIAFESKGEGASVYRDWSSAFGDSCALIEVGDPNSPAIDITDPKTPPKERAQFFVSAMTYAFSDGAVGDRSSETLQNVLTAAMTFPPEAFATTNLVNPSFLDITHALLGGVGDYEDAKSVAAAMTTYYTRVDDNDPKKAALGEALRSLGFLYGPSVSASAWRTNTEAPRNKINKLQQVAHWWSPSRPRGGWSDILTNHRAVVLNTGVTTNGILVDEEVSKILSAMIAYSLKGSIQRHCSNWQSQGKSVSIFADELALLAPSSSEVIEWLRDAGRSYGVRLTLATQRLAQLSPALQGALRSFGTTMIFQQSDSKVINEAVASLVLGGDVWTPAEIKNMPKFHAILCATSEGRPQPPVPIKALYWGNDYAKFAKDQGYL